LYAALMLQPRLVGAIVALGIVVQRPFPFLVLAIALLWSALVPSWSVFDGIYNYTVARPRQLARLSAAPAPRRFAAGLAGTFAFAIGIALLGGAVVTAWVLQGMLAVAVIQVIFRDACAGANVYHLLRRILAPKPPHPARSAIRGSRPSRPSLLPRE
jgi:hypothetical protein